MSIEEDILRIKMETLGAKGLDDVILRIMRAEDAVEELSQEFAKGAISEDQFTEDTREMLTVLVKLRKELAIGQEVRANTQAMDAQVATAERLRTALWDYATVASPLPAAANAQAVANDRAAASFASYAGQARHATSATDQNTTATQVAATTMDHYAVSVKTASVSTADFASRITAASTGMASTEASMGRLGKAVGRGGNFGQGMLQASYFVDDLQYGMKGIVNNIPVMLSSFGLGGGLAGALGIVAVAGAVAFQHMDDIKGLFEERWPGPKFDLTSLEGLKKKLEEIKKTKDDLEKKSTLNAGEIQKLADVRAEEKALQAEEEYRKKIKSLKDAKTHNQSATAAALDEALTESGQTGGMDAIITKLEKGVAMSDPGSKAKFGKMLADMKKGIVKGDEKTYEMMQDLSGSLYGKNSPLYQAMTSNAPWKKRQDQFLDSMASTLEGSANASGQSVHKDAMRKIRTLLAKGDRKGATGAMDALASSIYDDTNNSFSSVLKSMDREKLKNKPMLDKLMKSMKDRLGILDNEAQEVKALNEQGKEQYGEMLDELGNDAIKELGGIYGDKLKDQLVKDKREGASVGEQTQRLQNNIANALKAMKHPLAMFPEKLAGVADVVARDVLDDVDKMVEHLKQTEGLVKGQALRRIAQGQAERAQEAKDKLAQDEFAQMAGNMHAMMRRRNPNMPALTPQQQNQAGADMKSHFDGLGIGADKQVQLAKLFGNQRLGNNAHALANSMSNEGVDEKTIMDRVLAVYQRNGGQTVNIGAETNRQVNQILRLEGQMMQQISNLKVGEQRNARLLDRNNNAFGTFRRTASMTER